MHPRSDRRKFSGPRTVPRAATSVAVAAVVVAAALGAAPVRPAAAQPATTPVPEPLRPWVPWVLASHPDLPCPRIGETRLCAWPGRLRLDLDDAGGGFALEVVADRDLDLPLPGDAERWPRGVTDDGRAALLRRVGDRPVVALGAGRHRLAGRFAWSRLPESLPVPAEIALVDLAVRGRPVADPRREAGGLLWLAGSRGEEAEAERVDVEVSRRIDDGVPVRLTVHLALRVSGRPREADLGTPLPPGFAATSLASELPVRLAAAGGTAGEGGGPRLVAQLRPGEWTVNVEARSLGPVAELACAGQPPPWPEEEFWVFAPAPEIRAVGVEGAAAVDPLHTPLPEEWRDLAAFRLAPGGSLRFVESRRGQPEPPPDELRAARTWWLAEDGSAITSLDRLTGTLHGGRRLEALAPAELGRVVLQGDEGDADQVITLGPEGGRPGVEVRREELDLVAELTYPRGGALPAAGWNRDLQGLAVGLELPPGWTLLAAPGADHAEGAWIDDWTLLDLFFLLLAALATGKLFGRRWGALALAVFGLGWHEPCTVGLAAWTLALLALVALLRVVPAGRIARVLGVLRWVVAAGFALQLVLFVTVQWRDGLFPQLEHRSVLSSSGTPMNVEPDDSFAAFSLAKRSAPPPPGSAGLEALGYAGRAAGSIPFPSSAKIQEQRVEDEVLRARQVDASAVAQTGPGVPGWHWTACELTWSGPVAADHRVRLLLVGPFLNALLSLGRIAGVALLAICLFGAADRLAGWRRWLGRRAGRGAGAAPVVVLALLAAYALLVATPAAAQETPPPPASPPAPEEPPAGLLAELEARLTAPAPCAPDCVEVPRLALAADAAGLAIEAEVAAAARTAWALPGPSSVWAPGRVTVDGEPVVALRRGDDGFLLLRLEPGVHRVELSGPARDSLTLQMPLPPRTLSWRGTGWAITGFRPDAAPPGSVRLDRQLPAAAGAAAAGGEELTPWLELTRELDLGIPWLVHNELRRFGPSTASVAVRVPLLAGESVTTGGIEVAAGEAAVALERGETSRRWRSTLAETPTLTLTAPADRPWLERWVLACSPLWTCRAEAAAGEPAPIHHMDAGAWRPEWRPWPGESVTLRFVRPQPAPGATLTLDTVHLQMTPGRRLREGRLEITLRASRAGEESVTLPAAVELQSFAVDGDERPVRLGDGRLTFPVEPGRHEVKATWREDHALGLAERVPAVTLGSPAANVLVGLDVPDNRWLLWAGGPRWGSVVALWLYLPLLALAAWAVARFVPAVPLTTVDWLLLGAGLTQVPLVAAVVVPLWLLVFALRRPAAGKWRRRFQAVVLAVLWLGALGVLYAAVHAGLLGRPEMQIAGPRTGGGGFLPWWADRAVGGDALVWYADRAAGALPRPYVLWLPLWVFRLLMLGWALWLAARLLRWLPWAWRRLTAEAEAPEPAPAAERAAEPPAERSGT